MYVNQDLDPYIVVIQFKSTFDLHVCNYRQPKSLHVFRVWCIIEFCKTSSLTLHALATSSAAVNLS